MRKRRIYINEKQKLRIKLIVALLMVIAVLIFCDMRIRPIIKTVAERETQQICTQLVNEVVLGEIASDKITYNDLVDICKDANGNITSIEINAVTVNMLKAKVTTEVQKKLAESQNAEMKIRLGTLTGLPMFTGRGPGMSFNIVPLGIVQPQIDHVFETAGINQTRHEIMLNMDISVTAIIAGYDNEVNVPCSFLVADTVIVGKVPEYYTMVEDDQSSTISKINDYSKQK